MERLCACLHETIQVLPLLSDFMLAKSTRRLLLLLVTTCMQLLARDITLGKHMQMQRNDSLTAHTRRRKESNCKC